MLSFSSADHPMLRDFLEGLHQCEDMSFLVTPISPESHERVYDVGNGVGAKCVELFPKCWTERHLLIGNKVYVYKEEDLYEENLY